MKTRILPALAVVLLVGCSEDEATTPPVTEDSATVEDTAILDTGAVDTSIPPDTTVEEETSIDSSTTETATDGSTTETATDGSTTETATDGSTTETSTDGSTTETSTDGSTTETSTDAATDTRDAADATPPPSVKCGSATCDPATQVCCGGVTGGATCAPTADAGTCAAKFACSNSDTCGTGMKCCAVVSATVAGSECKSSCGTLEIQLCDSNDECPASDAGVDGAGACNAITGLGSATGYSRCQ